MIKKVYINCNKDGKLTCTECYCKNSILFDKKGKLVLVYKSMINEKCRNCNYICDFPKQFIEDIDRTNNC